jgi:hypothetical protein
MKFMKYSFFLLALVLALVVPNLARAQVVSRNVTALTLSASTVGTSATASITSQAFRIVPGHGFAIVPSFVLSTTGTSNVTFNFAVSVDGTTWTTTTPFTYAVAGNGTTTVIGFSNFPSAVAGAGADNILWCRLQSVTNANSGATVTINSVTVTQDNP